jgi:hypothetical protein
MKYDQQKGIGVSKSGGAGHPWDRRSRSAARRHRLRPMKDDQQKAIGVSKSGGAGHPWDRRSRSAARRHRLRPMKDDQQKNLDVSKSGGAGHPWDRRSRPAARRHRTPPHATAHHRTPPHTAALEPTSAKSHPTGSAVADPWRRAAERWRRPWCAAAKRHHEFRLEGRGAPSRWRGKGAVEPGAGGPGLLTSRSRSRSRRTDPAFTDHRAPCPVPRAPCPVPRSPCPSQRDERT